MDMAKVDGPLSIVNVFAQNWTSHVHSSRLLISEYMKSRKVKFYIIIIIIIIIITTQLVKLPPGALEHGHIPFPHFPRHLYGQTSQEDKAFPSWWEIPAVPARVNAPAGMCRASCVACEPEEKWIYLGMRVLRPMDLSGSDFKWRYVESTFGHIRTFHYCWGIWLLSQDPNWDANICQLL